jgi:sugar O-acyltransferase (sialic acid O-acetyltransferase NeuD family)
MEIKSLNVLGTSEPTITMLFDNLESNDCFPEIYLINNLGKTDWIKYENPSFHISILSSILEANPNSLYFLGVNKPANKLMVYRKLKGDNFNFATILNRVVSVSSTSIIGKGVHVNSLVSIAAHSHIGDFVSINRNASVGHHTHLEDFVTINPGANIAGFVNIGKGTLIGMGANVIDGIRIGANTIIGAGSLVTKDIPDDVIAYGNPCKIIRKNEAQSL